MFAHWAEEGSATSTTTMFFKTRKTDLRFARKERRRTDGVIFAESHLVSEAWACHCVKETGTRGAHQAHDDCAEIPKTFSSEANSAHAACRHE
jgi:hypothetical protein